MTITTNDTNITINSTNLVTLTGVSTVQLLVTDYLESTTTTDINIADITTGSFTHEIVNGVYQFELLINNTDNTAIREKLCYFVDYITDECSSTAKQVVDYINECGDDLDLKMNFYLLKESKACNCDCDSLLTIWESVKTKLDKGCNCTSC